MCGIAGFIDLSNSYKHSELQSIILQMSDTLARRGPDDSGIWVDERSGVALEHRRLSIIDLTAAGHQPMHSESGRYVIVYNGEIYNHNELRKELESNSSLVTHHSLTGAAIQTRRLCYRLLKNGD